MGRQIGDSGVDRHQDRAREVAAASDHAGVTAGLLGGTGRFSSTFYLFDDPAVAYLDTDELVHFGFYNEMKGVGIGEPDDTYVPDKSGVTIVLVTDRRVLALVGREEGDHEVSLHYDTVTGARFEVGDLHDRLVIETVSDTYHCWINSRFGPDDLEAAVSCIRERMADPHDLSVELGTGTDGHADDDGVVSDGGSRADDTDSSSTGITGTDAAGPGASSTETLTTRDTVGESEDDPLDRIEKLHSLKEAGAITAEEYERKKSELLDRV